MNKMSYSIDVELDETVSKEYAKDILAWFKIHVNKCPFKDAINGMRLKNFYIGGKDDGK